MTTRSGYTAVDFQGDLIAPELLDRIATGIDLDGAKPADYRAIGRRSVADEAERAWDDLKAAWTSLGEQATGGPAPKDSTGAARRSWIEPLFDALKFGVLASTGGGIASDDGQKRFPISHRWSHVPIHIVDWAAELDERQGGGGGAGGGGGGGGKGGGGGGSSQAAPHSLVQECLNTTSGHLWGIVTNGRRIRLLRDSTAIAGTAYVEFDLETIFDSELVSEFILLYRLLHVTRFETEDEAPPSSCWLEKWRTSAIQAGMRALDQMKTGVQDAITTLGTGYLSHPANGHLIDDLDSEVFHRALLRLTYRLLFLFVAEDKGALHPENTGEKAKERYRKYYSSARLRAHARRRRGTTHADLYQGLRLVLDALGSEEGQPKLGLPGLGGLFEQTEADAILDGLQLSNEHLLKAVRSLAIVRDKKTRRNRAIDYRHLDAEELGSVYESLLELVPKYSAIERRFELVALAGNQRKTTGSYYTPSNLIERLLDTTLDPVIDAAQKRGEERGGVDAREAIERELLGLTVCDPACGSGHFLVAAARRIAKRLAAVREQSPEPTPKALKAALREVVGRCIYGVDINPMAVELAKIALWMEALEPGKALGFLDAHIKCGNSLIGAYPALMAKGIPDEAWKPIEGDDSAFAAKLMKRNAQERLERERHIEGAEGLFDIAGAPFVSNTKLASQLQRIIGDLPDRVAGVRAQAKRFRAFDSSPEVMKARALANAWCAAFFWPKQKDAPLAPTDAVFRELERGNFETLSESAVIHEATELSERYRFFHWYVEFPGIFNVPEPAEVKQTDELTGWNGGFDCVIGNPPWEHVEVKDQEFFATRDSDIATASGSERKTLIRQLASENNRLWLEFVGERRKSEGERHFLRESGKCKHTAVGRINLYAVFAETDRILTSQIGRTGVIVPTGIATDATTQHYFRDLVTSKSLIALFDFRNSGFFPDVAGAQGNRFCLLLTSSEPFQGAVQMAFRATSIAEIDMSERKVSLTNDDFLMLNPNTGTSPVFRNWQDARITLDIYRRVPILYELGKPGGNAWMLEFRQGLFNITSDSKLFRKRGQLEYEGWQLRGNVFHRDGQRMLPLYEAKMFHHYNHRYGSYREVDLSREKGVRQLPRPRKQDLENKTFAILPRYWAPEFDVESAKRTRKGQAVYVPGVSSRLQEKNWSADWIHVWRDVTSGLDERTMINCILPKVAVPDGSLLMLSHHQNSFALSAILSSFACDFVARQKIGGTHLKFFTAYQLAVLSPIQIKSSVSFVRARLLELVYSAEDLRQFSENMGDQGDPFVWDEERRFVMRAELDALFFHLYGIERDDVDYIMETFPIVKKKDLAEFGSYRTKEMILEVYDRMAAAGVSVENPPVDGENFFSQLDPPPGHGPRHAPRES